MPEKTAQKEPGKKPAPSKKPKPQQEVVVQISLSELHPFPDHPFQVREDAAMQETAESVKEYGVLVPALARPREDGGYELIAGHRRKHACELAGLATMPVIVRDLDDDQATIIMVDSNLQRESLLPSERAFAYKMKMEAMRRQGKRNDLTSGQNGPKLTAELIGEETGDSVRQVKRYIRLTELIPDLLDMVDRKRLNFTIAVDISYIDKQTQQWLYEYIRENGFIKPSQISALRKYIDQENTAMTQQLMISILNSVIPIKAPAKKVTFTEQKLLKYFPADYSSKEMEQVIIALLEGWKKKQEE